MSQSDTPAAVLRRRELVQAFRRCTWKQRKYLRAVVEHDFHVWGPQRSEYNPNQIRRWLGMTQVRKALELLEEVALDDLCVSARKVVSEYTKVAFSDIGDLYDAEGNLKALHRMPRATRAAIREYTWTKDGPKVVMHDKLSALNALADFVKLSSKRVELTGKDGAPLAPPVINIVGYDNTDAAADTPAA